MIHGLISLLYNGLLRGVAGAPLQRLTALAGWLAGWLPGSLRLCRASSATAACCPRFFFFFSLVCHEKWLGENSARGCAHTHMKGSNFIQYRLKKYLGACKGSSEGWQTRKYQNPSRKKTLPEEIPGILVTSNGNMVAFLNATPPHTRTGSFSFASLSPPPVPVPCPHPWKERGGKNEEIKVVTC